MLLSLLQSKLRRGLTLSLLLLSAIYGSAWTQCIPVSSQIKGIVFEDLDYSGDLNVPEGGVPDIEVKVYDTNGALVGSSITNEDGRFVLDHLEDGHPYRLEFVLPQYWMPTNASAGNNLIVRNINAPSCGIKLGVTEARLNPGGDVPPMIVSLLVKGNDVLAQNTACLYEVRGDFNSSSAKRPLILNKDLGAVRSLAWKRTTRSLFAAAYIKQYAWLKDGKHDAIYKIDLQDINNPSVARYATLTDLGIVVEPLEEADADKCTYGAQAGRLGLGELALSEDESKLYVINISGHSVVEMSSTNPSIATTREFYIPHPACSGGISHPFALEAYRGKLYVGVTCTAETSKDENDLSLHVYSLNLEDGQFKEVLSTSFPKAFWTNSTSEQDQTQSWLTSLAFTDEGYMILGIADRKGDRYCKSTQLITQNGDILMASPNADGTWTMESNGSVGVYHGSGIRNHQGPGGGEFFGEDYWILGPFYHPEVSVGAVATVSGFDNVVNAVFDPEYSTFVGGIQRYSVKNGKLQGALELYGRGAQYFGKASGIGDVEFLMQDAAIEIGDYVWFDDNMNGVQDPDELPVVGVSLALYDSQCHLIGKTVTDSNGRYIFNESNIDSDGDGLMDGLQHNTDYYILIGGDVYDPADNSFTLSGKQYKLTIADKGQGTLSDENDSDGELFNTPTCSEFAGQPGISVHVDGRGSNVYSYDIGLMPKDRTPPPVDPKVFDLALRKTVPSAPVKPGEIVQFDIEVFNQGEVTASKFEVTDYLPEGLEFVPALNMGWISTGGLLQYTVVDALPAGQSIQIPLKVKLKGSATLDNIDNIAEISAAWDDKGQPANDVDSHYDMDPTNDLGGEVGTSTDDLITDSGTLDEDDQDPARVPIMDLALLKTVDVSTPVKVNQEVIFTLEVYNQGNVPVEGYTLVDYLPEGYDFIPSKNTGWSSYGDFYQYEMVEPLQPGAMASIRLTVQVSSRATAANLLNYAEIMSVKGSGNVDWSDRDFDSTPDDDPNNDIGGNPDDNTNDRIDDHGLVDEDDQDPAYVPIFDLALLKSNGNTIGNIRQDNIVEFTIRVFNQGNIAASNIRIMEYFPIGLRAPDTAASEGWVKVNDSTYYYDVAGTLLPGEEKSIKIKTKYLQAFKDIPQTNAAEIVYASDASGNPVSDFDSTPDSIRDNDPLEDDVVDKRDGTDEDDHDVGVTSAKWFDLALRKYTHRTLVNRGDTVPFYIQIINQGTIPADNINIVDYIPRGFDFLSGFGWKPTDIDKVYHKVMNTVNGIVPQGGVLPGDSIEVRIDLVVRQDARPGTLVNVAEIESATDEKGKKEPDIDSTPDADPTNDPGGEPGGATDNLTNAPAGMDEDDSDPALVFLAEVTSDPFCLYNATTPDDGQFREEITILGPTAQSWFIHSVSGLYSTTSPAPPAPPTPIATGPAGLLPVETVINSYSSFYSLNAISIDGQPFTIVFENEFGNRLTLHSPARYYSAPKIYGLSAACKGSLQDFHTDPIAGATYHWTLSAGGSIVGPDNQSQVQVQWNNVAGGPFQLNLVVQAPGQCLEPASYDVVVGAQPAQQVNCRSFVQVSLDSLGRAVITPRGLLQGNGYDYNSFAVMLTDANGNPIAGNIATCDHVGQMLTAKVINTCSGNSCWAKVTVEDKLPPIIECFDDTLSCVVFRKYQGPRVHDNCDPSPIVTVVDEKIEPICDDVFLKKITRTYVAKDKYGNTSAPCTQTIYLKRVNFDSLQRPPSRTNALGNPLICKAYKEDAKGHPDAVSVGVPMYNGYPLYPDFPFYCNVSAGYVDIDLGTTGCVKKYQRIWYVFELKCDTTFVRKVYNQQIEIADTTAPTIVCPDNMTVTTKGGYQCAGDVWLPVPQTSDNCSDKIIVTATYPGGFISDMKRATRIQLPLGVNKVTYRVYDGCYNQDSCEIMIKVEDNIPPVAVCTSLTTISLNENGVVHLYANALDAGSYDDCAIDSMAVQRMDEGAACGVQKGFSSFVEFCCADVGDSVRVIFRVWDAAGNYNDCMVRVEVQNKIPPTITCPACLRVPCTYKFEIDSLDKYFGKVVTDKNDIQEHTLYGPYGNVLRNCNRKTPLKEKTFTDGLAQGNCDVKVKERYIDNRDQCGLGYITRIFQAINSGGQQDACVQYIYFYDPTPFNENDITWPLDYETNSCDSNFNVPSNLPPGYDKPTFRNEDECSLVAANYVDEVYRFIANSDVCYKIVRKWTVIDWCHKDDKGFYRRWYHDQLIKVIDNVNPIITSDCSPVSTCTYDAECKGGPLELTASAKDDCTPNDDLQWEYQIDLDRDGSIDYTNTGIGGTATFTKNYPVGKHSILWQFKDRCGNTVTCIQKFEIKNCKAPTAYCKNIVVNLNPMDLDGDGNCDAKMIEVWAKDLDDGSNHPCGYPLKYSIGKDTTVRSVMYQCGDDGIHNVEMCVTDINGNQSCCTVQIVVQDNSGMDCCPFDIPCVKFPKDSVIYDCHASLDTSIFGTPDTKDCKLDSSQVLYMDTILDGKQDPYRCTVVSRVWRVNLYFHGRDTFAMDTQYIIIDNKFNEDSIIWPKDTVVLTGCNQSTDTTITGVATWKGEYCGEVTKTYADTDVSNPADACSAVRRRWTVVNHCENDTAYTFDQILLLHNSSAPVVTAPDDITVDNGKDSCSAFVRLQAVSVGMCTDAPMIVNDYNMGGADASDVYPVGTTKVTFTVTDSCGHTATDDMLITVRDNQKPEVNCPGDTTISCDMDLSNLNIFGVLSATDNCAIDSVIMDSIYDLNICNIGTIRRTIRAVDTAGNVMTCEQLITINNPGAIDTNDIIWPPDTVMLVACASTSPDSTGRPMVDTTVATCFRISISYVDTTYTGICNGTDTCTFIQREWTVIDSCQLGSGSGIFKRTQLIIVNNPMLSINCPADTTITCDQALFPLSQFGMATSSSQCGTDTMYVDSVLNINTCNVGTVLRIFTVEDTVGNSASCTQTINIVNNNAIEIGDITWPSDTVEVPSCASTIPDSTGRPSVDTSKASCYKLTISYKDTMYMALCNGSGTDTCTFIERTWTVVDSCQYDGVNGKWTHLQLIIVSMPIIHVTCPADTTITCDKPLFPLSQFGTASATSDCGIDSMKVDSMVNVNACNVGTVMRTFTFVDTLGNSMSCKQTITIVIDSAVTEANITWPMDTITVDSCDATDTTHTGVPIVDVSKASCSNVSISFVDTPGSSPDYCKVTLRKWTVVDSCQLDTMTMAGIWMHNQVIQVLDTIAPVLTPSVTDTTIFLDPDSCQIFVSGLTATATDNCSVTSITNNSAHANAGLDVADGVYPVGETTFYFFATDECGHTDSVQVKVLVKDTVPPSIVCHKDIQVLPDSGSIKVTIHNFLWSLSDNCSDTNNIMVSFDKNDFMDTTRVYNCDSLGGRIKKIFKIEMYAKDESGNIDSCVGQFELHDQDSVCFTSSLHRSIVGVIKLENGAKMEEVIVDLTGGVSRNTKTDAFGQYGFDRVPIGETYTVKPSYDGSYLKGVNTRDMVAIQLHMLGKKPLNSPYQMIAADVNGSESISSADIIAIRRLILGRTDHYPKAMPSWKFVDASYVFPDPRDPFVEPYPVDHLIPLLSHNEAVDFIGVKLGDVNGDVRLKKNNTKSYFRNGEQEDLIVHISPIMGDRYRFTLEANSGKYLSGAQFALRFGSLGNRATAVQFNDALGVTPENINLTRFAQGELVFSWVNNSITPIRKEGQNWLMSFDVVLKKDDLSRFVKALHFETDRLKAECYNEDVVHPLKLRVNNQEAIDPSVANTRFELMANVPNPFSNTTSIKFYLSDESSIVLNVLDVNGRVIHTVKGVYAAGLNEITLHAENFPTSGMYYYRLSLDSGTAIRKMIFIK